MTIPKAPHWAENVSVQDALVGMFAANEGDEALLREGFAAIVAVREAELRAALDDPEQFGWTGPATYAIAYAAAIRDILAFLGGTPDD